MPNSFERGLSGDGFMPHGMCYLWRADVLSLHVISDALIALAYFSIPFTLIYFVRKRKDLGFQWIIVCFAAFIVSCGVTHLMDILVIWHPLYWVSGSIKAITALASVPTAVLLARLIPQALRIPSPLALEQANGALEREVHERKSAEQEVRRLNEELEVRIIERTEQLETANVQLRREIFEREQAEATLQKQLVRLELLGLITRAIDHRQDLASILKVVVGSLEESLPIDFGCVLLYDAAANDLAVTCVGAGSATLASQLGLSEQARIAVDENGLARCVRGKLVYEPNIAAIHFPFPQRLVQGGLGALVASPLMVESKVFGVLVAARRETYSFSSGECEFLRQLSDHVALAANQAETHLALARAYEDLQQTQQAVLQQERLRALGQMASGIAHDINNAISPMLLYTESLLEREQALSTRGREELQVIQRAVEDVAQTVKSLGEFYRQREPQEALTAIQLNQLVEQVIDLTRARWHDIAQRRGFVIDIQTSLLPQLPAIMAIEGGVREALVNLIFNAVDAMPNGGLLAIRTGVAASKANVFVEVCDSGIGMDEDTRRRCLEPFFTTKGERGTGLGLAMVYGMVQRQGAEIDIQSAVGQGTTVRLSFPSHAPTLEPAKEPGVVSLTVPRLRILVVDDDPLLLKSLSTIVEADGHRVTTAKGGQEGIDAFRAAQQRGAAFDLVISDLGMPYVDGRKVAAAIKQLSPLTPLILLTGWGQRLMAEDDVPPHVDRFLSKPPRLKHLREAILSCCVTAA